MRYSSVSRIMTATGMFRLHKDVKHLSLCSTLQEFAIVEVCVVRIYGLGPVEKFK
jgi:hypothetical protein